MSSGGGVAAGRVPSGKKGRKKVRPATAAPAVHHIPVIVVDYPVINANFPPLPLPLPRSNIHFSRYFIDSHDTLIVID